MSFDLSEYVDVAERIRIFKEKFPEGSLQSELTLTNGASPGWLCKAFAYRDGNDERPGIGHAFEPIPGKTPYTRDSEAMNAETSAWGRAIVALGFETKKIASAEEVRARDSGAGNKGGSFGTAPAPDKPFSKARPDMTEDEYLALVKVARSAGATASFQVCHFGSNKGVRLGEMTSEQIRWYAEDWKMQDESSEYDHRFRQAAIALHAGQDTADFIVPF